jgi:hypothetical protein
MLKLEAYGLSENSLKLLKSYLENRNKTKVTEKINKCPTKVILHLR